MIRVLFLMNVITMDKNIYVNEIDMRINGLKNWFVTTNLNQTDTTKWDFWTIALHEFGHAILLEHVLSPSDVLYPFYSKQRIDRDINLFAESGANWIMDTIEIVSPHCNGTLNRNTFGCVTSTNEIISQNKIIKVYPNPFSNQITIEFDNLDNAKNYEISIIDVSGRIIFTENGSIASGINQIQILKDDLGRGFYFIKVRLDNNVSFIKVIKT